MYFVHKFTSRFARQQAIIAASKEVMSSYIAQAASDCLSVTCTLDPSVYANMVRDTDELVDRWVNDHPSATLADAMMFISETVNDFIEEYTERMAS